MATRTAARPAPTKRARASQQASRTSLSHHQRKCTICRHPDRETIEEMFVHWHSASRIYSRFMLPDRSTIYDHAHATGLYAKRRRNLRYALENIIERSDEAPISSNGIVAAIKAYASLTTSGEWIEPARRVIYTSISSSDASPRAAAHPSPNYSSNKNAAYAYPQPKRYPSDYPAGYDPSDGWWAYSAAQSRCAGADSLTDAIHKAASSRPGRDVPSSPSDGESADHQPQSQNMTSASAANTSAPAAARAPQTTTHTSPAPTHPTTTTTRTEKRVVIPRSHATRNLLSPLPAPQQTKNTPQPANSNRYTSGLKIPPTHTKQTPAPRSNRYK
ncbi:MAG TPA: hypothetical protein VGR94_11360 [Candidatus Acidoferrales bacterium]|nr:hypothetical protein [Candidatus Acidoferrales bacterium]